MRKPSSTNCAVRPSEGCAVLVATHDEIVVAAADRVLDLHAV